MSSVLRVVVEIIEKSNKITTADLKALALKLEIEWDQFSEISADCNLQDPAPNYLLFAVLSKKIGSYQGKGHIEKLCEELQKLGFGHIATNLKECFNSEFLPTSVESSPITEPNLITFELQPAVKHFVGRSKEWQQLEWYLNSRQLIEQLILINGPAGIGKKELVRKCIKNYVEEHSNSKIIVSWLEAENGMILYNSIAKFCQHLGIHATTENFELEDTLLPLEDLLSGIIIFLNNKWKCLIILSDINESNDIFKALVAIVSNLENVFLLVVSRNKVFPLSQAHVEVLVGCFDLKKSMNFLENVYDMDPLEDLEMLCENLGNSPAALDQAGSYIKELRLKDRNYGVDIYLREIPGKVVVPGEGRLSNVSWRWAVVNRHLTVEQITDILSQSPEESTALPVPDYASIYLKEFLDCPIDFYHYLKICPRIWALAFLQMDLSSISKVLWQAVRKNKRVTVYTKKECIMSAAVWMLKKQQDPWKFRGKIQPATLQERQEMHTVFKQFNEFAEQTDCVRYKCDCKLCLKNMNMENRQKHQADLEEIGIKDINLSEMHKSMSRLPKFYESFRKVNSTADMVKFMTLRVAPKCKDIFVGPVGFEYEAWNDCLNPGFESVEFKWNRLFQKFLPIYFPNGEATYDDICPVIRLSICGAVAWINQKKRFQSMESFVGKNTYPNLMLSPDELRRVKNFVNELYGSKTTSSDVNY